MTPAEALFSSETMLSRVTMEERNDCLGVGAIWWSFRYVQDFRYNLQRLFLKMNNLMYFQLSVKFLNVILKSFYTAILVTSK